MVIPLHPDHCRLRRPRAAGTVFCLKVGRDLPAMAKPPFSGNLGDRIFKNISAQEWDRWKKQATILMNHHNLSMADPEHRHFLMEQMEEFFFGESAQPPDWVPPGQGGKGGGGGGKGAPAARKRSERRTAPRGCCSSRVYRLGHAPSGIAWPLAFLRRAGLDAETLDLAVEPFSSERAAAADVVVIGADAHRAPPRRAVAERVRAANRRAHVCFHGLYASLNADALLEGPADSIAAGECEDTLVELVRALGSGRSAEDVPGLTTRGRRVAPVRARLSFPVPDRTTLPPPARYAGYHHDGDTDAAAYVEASRGCLHLCTPLPHPAGLRRAVLRRPAGDGPGGHPPAGGGGRDAHHLRRPGLPQRSGARAEGGPRRARGVPAADLRLHRQGRAHPEAARPLPRAGARSGCVFMISAVESLSDTVLTILEKNHTAADVEEALAIVRDAGITFRPTWVPFTPWTTRDDYLEILDFVEEHGLIDNIDPVQYSIRLLVPPGSYLLDDARCCRTGSGRWTRRRSATAGRIPTRGMDRSRRRSPPWWSATPGRGRGHGGDLLPGAGAGPRRRAVRWPDPRPAARPRSSAAAVERTVVLLSGADRGSVRPRGTLGGRQPHLGDDLEPQAAVRARSAASTASGVSPRAKMNPR